MSGKVTLNSRSQIAVPAAVRRQLGIKRGDKLLIVVIDGGVMLLPEPKDYAADLAGLHAEIWEGTDAAEYIRQERDAWER